MYSVLIVDDFRAFLKQMERFSYWEKQNDFVLFEKASNGAEALSILQNNQIDVVITDIKMPKMTGLDLLNEIVEQQLETVVILLSEYEEFSYAQKGLKLGAFDYVVKPIDEEKLIDVMTRVKLYLDQKKKQEDSLLLQRKRLIYQIISGKREITREVMEFICDVKSLAQHTTNSLEPLLLNTLQNIFNVLFYENPWLEHFLPCLAVLENALLNAVDSRAMEQYFLHLLEETHTFFYWYQNHEYSELVKRVCQYVLSHLSEKLSLSEMAAQCFVNKSYLSHVFKVDTGISFVEFVIMSKMYAARKMLSEPGAKVNEIAEQLGYEDPKYFAKNFKNFYGVTPTEYKKNFHIDYEI